MNLSHEATTRIAAALLLMVVIVLIVAAVLAPHDSTDPPGGRSGLRLYIDEATGCHYLAPVFGSATPRMGANGQQVCTGRAGETAMLDAIKRGED